MPVAGLEALGAAAPAAAVLFFPPLPPIFSPPPLMPPSGPPRVRPPMESWRRWIVGVWVLERAFCLCLSVGLNVVESSTTYD